MLYDLGVRPPRRSLLESIFRILTHRRRSIELLQTKVFIEAALAPHVKESKLHEALERYANALMPFLKNVVGQRDLEMKEALSKWAARGPIQVTPLHHVRREDLLRVKSSLVRSADRVKELEEQRRLGKLRSMD